MIGIATTIKDNLSHTLLFRTLSNQFSHFSGQSDLVVIGNSDERFLWCLLSTLWGGGQRCFCWSYSFIRLFALGGNRFFYLHHRSRGLYYRACLHLRGRSLAIDRFKITKTLI